MLILGIDTSTETCALGLMNKGELLAELNVQLYRRHSERLIPNIDWLLQEAGIDIGQLTGLAVTIGPGSFTGLRIGLSTVKTFAQELKIPVLGISTLDVLAYMLYRQRAWVVPVLDARRERVYTALYRGGERDIIAAREWPDGVRPVSGLLEELNNLDPEGDFYFVGNGVKTYGELISEAALNTFIEPGVFNLPRGGIVAELGSYYLKRGQADDLDKLKPNYLKRPQAEINYTTSDQ